MAQELAKVTGRKEVPLVQTVAVEGRVKSTRRQAYTSTGQP